MTAPALARCFPMGLPVLAPQGAVEPPVLASRPARSAVRTAVLPLLRAVTP